MAGGAIWIGGGTGAGKTTVTRTFAGRHGLRVFPVDAFWYSHAARLPEPEPDPDEQWLGRSPVAQAAEFEALTRRRWPLILADLAALAPVPPVVVEGPQVLPDLVPPGDPAVFLIATEEFQRSVLEQRPLPETADPPRALANRIEKDRLYGARVAELAVARGFRVIEVDGTRPISSILTDVEQAFAGADLASDPSAAAVTAARRWENTIVAENIRAWLGTAHVPPELPTVYTFVCECGVSPCDATVPLPLREFDSVPQVLAPGH